MRQDERGGEYSLRDRQFDDPDATSGQQEIDLTADQRSPAREDRPR
jgi:hypothetical protein